jgi:DNA-directed RNA polymerase subunit RPC12/RpoP
MSEYVDGSFRCSICGKEFPTKNDADRHYQDVHDNQDIEIGE